MKRNLSNSDPAKPGEPGSSTFTTNMEYYAGLMESIRDAVISFDKDFIIKSWNPGARDIYGWTANEAIGKNIDEVLKTDFGNADAEALFEKFKNEGHSQGEVIQQTKSGQHIHVHFSSSAIFDKKHQLSGAVTVYKNISERKRLEAELKDLNEHLEEQVKNKTEELTDIFERITDGFIALDKNWNYIYANEKIRELTKHDPKELIGKNVWEVFPDAVGTPTYDTFMKAMNEQVFSSNIDHFEPLNLWQENYVYPSLHGISVFIRDISDKKRAEEKIKKANRLYFFISQINQMIVRANYKTTLFREACNIAVGIGRFKMAWIGMVDEKAKAIIPEMYAGEGRDYLQELKPIPFDGSKNRIDEAMMEGQYIICNDIERAPDMAPWKDSMMNRGYKSSMILPVKKFGKVVGAFCFYAATKDFFDTQEIALLEEATGDVSFALENIEKEELRKKAEEEISRAYEANEITLNRISDSVVSVDNNWRYTFLNDAALATHPLGKAETIGKSMWDVHPEMKGTVFWDKYHEAMEKKISVEVESYYEPFDTWFYVKIYPSAEGLTFFYSDITVRKKADELVRNSEEQRRLIMNASLEAIICMNSKGQVTFWNPQAEKIFGWSEAEVVGKELVNIIIPEQFREAHIRGMERYFETGEGPVLNTLLELKAIKRNQKEFPIELTILPIKQGNEEFFCAFIRDLSRQKEEDIRISKATINAQENERHHIGLELHDNVNQILIGSLLHLGMIRQSAQEKIPEVIDTTKGHILNAIDEIRKLSHQLAPASFDDISLKQAFESLLTSINTPKDKFRIIFGFEEFEKDVVNTNIQINLYRILQEHMSNIVKYSKASLINVSLKVRNAVIGMRIYDNGVGFDTGNPKKGIGLGNMKKRTELFSGSFILNSSPGKGCELIIEIPLDKE